MLGGIRQAIATPDDSPIGMEVIQPGDVIAISRASSWARFVDILAANDEDGRLLRIYLEARHPGYHVYSLSPGAASDILDSR